MAVPVYVDERGKVHYGIPPGSKGSPFDFSRYGPLYQPKLTKEVALFMLEECLFLEFRLHHT